MKPEPRIVEREPVRYVGSRATISMDQFHTVADMMPEMMEWLDGIGAKPASTPFFRYDVVDVPEHLEVACCIPVSTDVQVTGDFYLDTLPGGRYASVTHHGHPDQLIGITEDLLAWGPEHGHDWDVEGSGDRARWGGRAEIYKSEPDVPLDEWETELVVRLAS